MTFAWLVVVFVLCALSAVAQTDAPPTDSSSVTVPIEGAIGAALGLVVAFASFLSAVIPAKKMPAALRKILDLIGQNWGHARNVEGPR